MAARPRRILVGFDGSEASRRALEPAADLAGYGSSLAVVHVKRSGSASNEDPAAHEIVAAAKEVGADLIVVGRRNVLRRVPGSVGSGRAPGAVRRPRRQFSIEGRSTR